MSRYMAMAWAGLVLGAGWLVGGEAGPTGTPPRIGGFGLKGMAGPGALQDVWGELLGSEAVRKELGLDPEQVEELIAISRKASESMRRNFEEMQELRDVAPEQRKGKYAEIAARAKSEAAETRRQIERVLRPPQLTRLNQLALQLRGVAALEDKEVQGKLRLTEEQKRELSAIRADVAQQIRECWRPGVPLSVEERQQKVRSLLKDGETKSLALLTAAQKAQWEEMKGSKFDFKDVRPWRGGPPKP